jgi:hypothetical protein
MGFNTTATTINLTARLTPVGRKKLVTDTNLLITNFSLGDSDANYYTSSALLTGQIPSSGGFIGPNTTSINSVTNNTSLKSTLIVNGTGVTTKPVEIHSTDISTDIVTIGQQTVSGTSLLHLKLNKVDYTDSLTNLFTSAGLPITPAQITNYTATTLANGGFADTAISGLSNNRVLLIAIDNTKYGELIDAKSLAIQLTTISSTFNIYSTFENKGQALTIEDAQLSETSVETKSIGDNIAFLFSDDVQKPNNDVTLSWATGSGSYKPFSVVGKQLFNMVTGNGLVVDKAIGIALLDKGLLVITHPDIVDNFYPYSNSGATVVTLNSVSTDVYQNITCIAARGEFGLSTNPTFELANVPRVSEIALYDAAGDMIAIAKPDRHILKSINEFQVFSIQISL